MDGADVTALLKAAQGGASDAARRLIDTLHSELRQMAERKMRAERPGHTLQPTALLNEAYLRLFGAELRVEDRAHFFGAAAKAMERVLVDHARQKRAQKRGGDAARVTLQDLVVGGSDLSVLDVQGAVDALEQDSPELATLVRYRYFVGMTLEQIAEIEGVSLATIKRRWSFARAWLYDRLEGEA